MQIGSLLLLSTTPPYPIHTPNKSDSPLLLVPSLLPRSGFSPYRPSSLPLLAHRWVNGPVFHPCSSLTLTFSSQLFPCHPRQVRTCCASLGGVFALAMDSGWFLIDSLAPFFSAWSDSFRGAFFPLSGYLVSSLTGLPLYDVSSPPLTVRDFRPRLCALDLHGPFVRA